MNIFLESSGSLVSASIIKSIQSAGFRAIASDISYESVGRYLSDEFVLSPKKNDPMLWDKFKKIMIEYKVHAVFPSFDPTLHGWSCRKDEFMDSNTCIILSDASTVQLFQDKYQAYKFFLKEGIRTPETSLEKDFSLVKPRVGSGAKGVIFNASKDICMEGMLSQEYIKGEEYTVDVFCNQEGEPVYILPRLRLGIVDGKSTSGIIIKDEVIQKEVNRICQIVKFRGPVNFQCIKSKDGKVSFLEVNPRLSGGMILSFSASENWINLAIKHFVFGDKIKPKQVKYGLGMHRYYSEIFF
jgi:carbamoyl-phosphate synthase large subunit